MTAFDPARPPEERANAGDELLESEGLRHVVVRAGVEAGDPVLDLVAGREHQDRNAVTAPAETPADLEAVDHRHQDVEDDRVGLGLAVLQPRERLAAVGRELDLVPLELERALQRLANGAFVVDNQDSHSPIVLAEAERLLREGPTYGLATRRRTVPCPLRAWTRMR